MLRRSSRLQCTTASRLPTWNLADAPVVLPNGSTESIESQGHINKEWIANLPQYAAILKSLSYVPPAHEFWHRSKHEAFKALVQNNLLSYYDLIHYVEKQGYTFLISDLLVASDAPLPHLVYEDIMKALMFCSKQDTMEKQFALDPSLLRTLFCQAAHHVLLDKNYFGRIEDMFRMVEQQQRLSSELLSSWVMVLACAGMPAEALTYARLMDAEEPPFDPTVFSLMLHPHLDPTEALTVSGGGFATQGGAKYEGLGPAGQAAAKGALKQQRLQKHIQNEVGTASASAIHGLFNFYNLTMNHSKKWETIRVAIEDGVQLSQRTVDVAASIFRQEQGRRCGPLTCVELCNMFAARGDAESLLMTLVFQRKCELLPEFAQHGHYEFQYVARQEILHKAQEACAPLDPDWDTRLRPAVEALLNMGTDGNGADGRGAPDGIAAFRGTQQKQTPKASPLAKLKFGPLLQLLRGQFPQGVEKSEEEPSTADANKSVAADQDPAAASIPTELELDASRSTPSLPVVSTPNASGPPSLLKPDSWLQCVAMASKPVDKGGVLLRRPRTPKTSSGAHQIVSVSTDSLNVRPSLTRVNQDQLASLLQSTDVGSIMECLNASNSRIGTTRQQTDQDPTGSSSSSAPINVLTGRKERPAGAGPSVGRDRLNSLRESVWADPSLLDLD